MFSRSLLTLLMALCSCGLIMADETPDVLFLIGEHEYGTPETLPAFAREHLPADSYRCTFVHAASDDRTSLDCHRFPGLAKAIGRADLLVLSTRRRFPPAADLERIRDYVRAGKPLVVIRTASHAFQARAKGTGYTVPEGHAAWNDFDIEVLGADYHGHYGGRKTDQASALLRRLPEQHGSPLFAGIDWRNDTPVEPHLYRNRALADDAALLLSGSVPGQPATHQPVAWTRSVSNRVFATSLGGRADFATDWFPLLLKNAVDWALVPRGEALAPSGLPIKRNKEAIGTPLSPAESAEKLVVPADLRAELLLAEPTIAQPNFFNFDERGRLWMVNYRQYPEPAGLTALSRDRHWRTTYDKVPPPPGHPDFVRGRDQITVHSDTTGDGTFDQTEIVLEGLNLATGLAHDRDGLWVLQPPYLLFYPASELKKEQPVPVVHLRGFGLHDTHSIATALCWGPDGWLYGCHGSTVTSDVLVEGRDAPALRSVGQNIWRYHPRERVYEVFAEGGGNIWSCEFDAVGRVYAGANGGHPAFHYLQGGYYAKTFRKHGALSNPHSYGYLPGIRHPKWQRVSCNVFVYEEVTLPARYRGTLFAANPIQGWLSASRLSPTGLNFDGTAIDCPLDSRDRWFRPVIADSGPDGGVYVADWYDSQVNHMKHQEGVLSAADGRLYRIAPPDTPPLPGFDLSNATDHELVDLLHARSRWWRETAQRVLWQRGSADASVRARLRALLDEPGQVALEAMWCLHGIEDPQKVVVDLERALGHANPHLRRWAFRLVGDRPQLRDAFLAAYPDALPAAVARESDLEVLGQAASTAKRLPAAAALPLVRTLLERPVATRHADLEHVIWWAAEAHCDEHASAVLAELGGTRLAPKLVRRLALTQPALMPVLFEQARNAEVSDEDLLAALQLATRGQTLAAIPDALLKQLGAMENAPLSLRLQLGDPAAFEPAMARVRDVAKGNEGKENEEDLRILRVFGERPPEDPAAARSLATELTRLTAHKSASVRLAALQALPAFPDADIAPLLAVDGAGEAAEIQAAIASVLTSRPAWAVAWLKSGKSVPVDALARMRQLEDDAVRAALAAFDDGGTKGPAGVAARETQVRAALAKPGGDPYKGMALYAQRCGTCHKLFDRGGAIGPDLTAYQRNDLDSLLKAILDPGAEIREGYETITVETQDGRSIHGFLTRETDAVVSIRSLAGHDVTVPVARIKKRQATGTSLMPAGLIDDLDEESLRDLFGYLRTMQPMNVR